MTGYYRGWKTRYDASAPVTGRYRAERHGVGMCAGTADALMRMIDVKRTEEQQERDRRLQMGDS